MKAPVSVCIIVKNEPLLEESVQSIREYINEIIIVDTGSTDNTIEVAKRIADKFEIYTECNNPDTGLIENFSQARQRSFDLATQPWVMWMDADDIIEGGENLVKLTSIQIKDLDAIAYLFPYEYSYNTEGQCTCRHYRERLVSNKNYFHWTNPVHEVIIPNDNTNVSLITMDDIVFKHRRQYSNKQPEIGRNLRILRKYFEKVGDSDARQMYYLGLECCNAGLIDEAIGHLTKYVDISGWDDERVMACLKLIDIYQALGQYHNGLKWSFKTIEINENWGEGYLAAGKMFYYLALAEGPQERRNWERCAHFIKTGLSFPPTKTLLFINPLDREVEIHRYLNMALNKLGNVKGALESVNIGLQKQPNDNNLLTNKKLYETFLSRHDTITAINKLKDVGEIDQVSVELITALVNKQISSAEISFEKKQNIPELSTETDLESPFPKATSVNDSNTWTIPNTWNFDGYPLKLSNDQLQASVIMIWKQYMLHDEVLSAISFLEQAPYNVRHSFATQKALSLTKVCLNWMDDKDDFQKINAPGNPEVEAGNPLPNKLIMSEGHRFDFIVNRLKANSTLVDFGSMDGCFTNRYGMLGHKPLGLDVCESSVKLARKKAIEFNTGAEYVCAYFHEAVDKVPNDHFEYATSTDTYEHLKDPVQEMLIPAKKMLKADGKFLLATPHGAWMRGKYLDWAHPWLYAKEGKSWLSPFPRAHLVAPTVWTLTEHFREAGYWVKDCYPDLCDHTYDLLSQDITGQGNLFAEAHVTAPNNYPGLDIVFYIGDGVETWTPNTIDKSGMGGSETLAREQARGLASFGHRVRVYNSCGEHGEGIYDGVEYHQTNKYQDLKCDVLIVSRYAQALSDSYNIQAKLKLIWVHDLFVVGAQNHLLLKADRILALSEFHKQNLINAHHIHPDHIIVTRNGIDLSRFDKDILRDPFKCVNSSSPDRSWPILLDVWSDIKKQVPEASLSLAYGFKNWEYAARNDKLQQDLIQRLKTQISEMKHLGVSFLDRINQNQLAEEMLSAGALIHPTWFQETSGITFMEAQAAGLKVISTGNGALPETVGDRGHLIYNKEWTSLEYRNEFIKNVVDCLKNNDFDRKSLQQYAQENFGLKKLAQEWNDMLYKLLENKKTNPVIPYMPTVKYR